MSRGRRQPERQLDLFLRGELVGELERHGPTRYRLRYTDDAVARHGEGALLLSTSLPVRRAPYRSAETKPFFEGLLPEGAIRTTIARSFGFSEDNGFALLAELGADCAGAVAVLPGGARAPTPETGSTEWLDDDELAQAPDALPRSPLGVHGHVRLSLAGVQPKLVVARSACYRLPSTRWRAGRQSRR